MSRPSPAAPIDNETPVMASAEHGKPSFFEASVQTFKASILSPSSPIMNSQLEGFLFKVETNVSKILYYWFKGELIGKVKKIFNNQCQCAVSDEFLFL